ncbi:MAG TPA: hypothetical protein VIN05_09015 [Roseovarius sp.]
MVTEDCVRALPVYTASDITVVSGANPGDEISFADELDLDDIYEVRQTAAVQGLTVAPGKDCALAIASGSALGRAGHEVHLDATLTMMTSTGVTTELMVMVEVDSVGYVAAIYALPLTQLIPCTEYILINIDRHCARARLSEAACVSFLRSPRAAIAAGAQIAF